MKLFAVSLFIFVFILSAGCSSSKNEPPVVLCAAGMSDIVGSLCDDLKKTQNIQYNVSYAASAVLARQIEQGIPAGMFFSANKKWIDMLDEKNLLKKNTIRAIFKNYVVCISPISADSSVNSLNSLAESGEKIMLADPSTAPVGKYTVTALERAGLKEKMQDRIIHGANVRTVLAAVETGAVSYAFVYKNVAAGSDKVKISFQLPHSLTGDVIFYCAETKENKSAMEIRLLSDALLSAKGKAMSEKMGYEVITQ